MRKGLALLACMVAFGCSGIDKAKLSRVTFSGVLERGIGNWPHLEISARDDDGFKKVYLQDRKGNKYLIKPPSKNFIFTIYLFKLEKEGLDTSGKLELYVEDEAGNSKLVKEKSRVY